MSNVSPTAPMGFFGFDRTKMRIPCFSVDVNTCVGIEWFFVVDVFLC